MWWPRRVILDSQLTLSVAIEAVYTELWCQWNILPLGGGTSSLACEEITGENHGLI